MRKAKKIEIVDATVADWYYEMKGLGCIFEVTEECKDAYSICIGGVSNCFIVGKEDVKVVEWIEPSYRERQAEWIKENDIKVGDKVKFVCSFKPYQDGFKYSGATYDTFPLNTIHIIKNITEDYIGLRTICKTVCWPMPYFALEPVKEEYQPCETVEEKLLFIGKKVRREKDGTIIGMITGMYDDGFRLGSDGIIYADSRDLLEGYELLDGSPIGVNKVKELLE